MSAPKNPNAFPACNEANVNDTIGMTLRDWFAGQAVAGLLGWAVEGRLDMDGKDTVGESLAFQAYGLADAMLAERSKS